MTAKARQIASSLAGEIAGNAGSLPIAGAVSSLSYLPIYDLKDLTAPKIPVAPTLETREPASRSSTSREYVIGVAPHVAATMKAGGRVDDDKVDEFVDLMDELANIIERGATTDFAGASFRRMETRPLYDTDLLSEKGVLRGVILVTFQMIARPS